MLRGQNSYLEYLHHFVAEVVDYFYGYAAGLGLLKRPGSVAVQRSPRVGIDFGFERGSEGAVGIVLAEEIGVADEETFFVVVGVDEPAGDAFGGVTADLASGRVKYIHSVHFHAQLAVFLVKNGNVWLAEDDKEVAFSGALQLSGHVQVGIHPRFKHRNAAEFTELRGVRLVVKRAGDQHV